MGPTLTIPKRITHGDELVLLRKDEYERLIRHKEEIAHALRVIAEGEKAYSENHFQTRIGKHIIGGDNYGL